MKKRIVILTAAVLLAALFVSCHSPMRKRNDISSDMYQLSDQGVLEKEDIRDEQKHKNKTVTLFGNKLVLKYDTTQKDKRWLHDKILYTGRDDRTNQGFYVVSLDSATGALMTYTNGNAGKDRTFQSEVNDRSSKEEFLSYAEKLVSHYTSVEGCEVIIRTTVYEYDDRSGNYYPGKSYDDYVNNTENISDFYAIYRFDFYKTINGVRRYDDNVIEIHSTGEVFRLWFHRQDDLYAPFADVTVDTKQAEALVKERLRRVYDYRPNECLFEFVPSLAATKDGVLWLQMEVYVTVEGGGTAGYDCLIKVSELTDG